MGINIIFFTKKKKRKTVTSAEGYNLVLTLAALAEVVLILVFIFLWLPYNFVSLIGVVELFSYVMLYVDVREFCTNLYV